MSPPNAAHALAVAAENALFANVPREIVERTLAEADLVELAPGERVIVEGTPVEADEKSMIYLLIEGHLLVSRTVIGGRPERLSTMVAGEFFGEFFGELGRTGDHRRSATVTAVTAASVARIPGPVTDALIATAPQVMHTIASAIAQRLRAADEARLQARLDEERLSIVGRAAAMLVHDLRNPLAVIRDCNDLIEQGVGDVKTWARRSRTAAEFMLAMVDDLLEFSRGNRVHVREPFLLSDVIDYVEASGLVPVERAGAIVVHRSYGPNATIAGDHRALSRALLNIVKNATEAMAAGGTLTFATRLIDDSVHFEIEDTGPGIPSHILPRLFDPFASYGKAGGTGLGMAMAKAAIDAHDGTVAIDTNEGGGTRFSVIIPVVGQTNAA